MKKYEERLELFEVVNINSDSEFRSKIMDRDDIVAFVEEELGYDNCENLDNEAITNIIRNYDYEVYSLQKSYPECFGLEEDDKSIDDYLFTDQNLIKHLINVFEEYDIDDYSDLHNLAFNSEFYINDKDEAKKVLNQYGALDAIEKIINYEQDYFGEIYTDVTNNIKLANMLYYIIGEEFLCEKLDFIYDFDEANEENNKIIVEKLKKML